MQTHGTVDGQGAMVDTGEMDTIPETVNMPMMDAMINWEGNEAEGQNSTGEQYIDVSDMFELNLTETPEYKAAYAAYPYPLDISDMDSALKVNPKHLNPMKC
jgi:hypothetical protein